MYKSNNQLIFSLDDDSDRFNSFKIAESYFRKKSDLKVIEYYAGGWSTSFLKFETEKIYMELIYMDFGGTELRVHEDISENDLLKVNQWFLEIYNEIHKTERPSL
jgi:hypothetical protein